MRKKKKRPVRSIAIRFLDDELALVRSAAKARGLSINTFVRRASKGAAQFVLESPDPFIRDITN
jgi:uncharacterized protein (DUF1778 family)